jgi:hypothetical protein
MYTGVMGDAFKLKIDALQARNGHTNLTQSDIPVYTQPDILQDVTEGLELLLDSFFGSIGASQLMLFNESTPVNATMQFSVVRLGAPEYVYSSFAINLVNIVYFAFEIINTRFWKDLPLFNGLDIKSAIICFAASGPEPPNTVRNWNGDAADHDVGRLMVKLGASRNVLYLKSGIPSNSSQAYLLS